METMDAHAGSHGAQHTGRALTAAITLVLVAATISEGLVALGVGVLSPSTGDWDVRNILLVAAFLALFFGGPLFVAAAAFSRFAEGLRPGVPFVALATGAVVVARFLSYDPYYARTCGACRTAASSRAGGSSSWPEPPSARPSSRGATRAWVSS